MWYTSWDKQIANELDRLICNYKARVVLGGTGKALGRRPATSKGEIRTNAINVSIEACFQITPKSRQFFLFSESSNSIYVSSVRTFFPVFPAIGSNRQPKVFFRVCRKPDWSNFKLVEFDLKVFFCQFGVYWASLASKMHRLALIFSRKISCAWPQWVRHHWGDRKRKKHNIKWDSNARLLDYEAVQPLPNSD